MKNEIDALMQASHVDALLVVGAGQHNPAMVYLTGGGHLTNADLIKKQGETAVLFHGSMERDEAAKSGLTTRCYDLYPMQEYLKETNGNQIEAAALRYARMFADCGVTTGTVALYGSTELGTKFAILSHLQKIMPGLSFTGFSPDPILMTAMMTKSSAELARIRKMGQITTGVVGRVRDFLAGQNTQGETLVNPDGSPVTIGQVKGKINLWLAEAGAENPENTIFAIGRDAGIPHSQGNNDDPLTLGKTIVFDIFPCETGGGYYYDFTRTWCLGYAPDDVLKLYADVKQVYAAVTAELKENAVFKTYQTRTNELFEAQGHPTMRIDPATQEGYVHSLGHGLGLRVHEMPFSGYTAGDNEKLVRGSVFTIEPGLYYPERGMGVRIEDTWFINENGQPEKMVDFPQDLIIPLQ
ncbi:MAG: hypothetical protein CVU39_25470 [Chloroflexi bacterium HGW-Chloroflexi-10]|nr:MAG: hypothetical protein CVU39_25470 [Chloroflexi bacterium HGW-Chloroflexi-10]